MAVMFVMEFKGVGEKEYDAVMREMHLDQLGAKWPEGLISHTAARTGEGWCVVDLWQSEQDFGRFREARLGPATAKVGLPAPRVLSGQVYNRH